MPLSDLASALAAATGPSHALNERMATEVFGWKLYPHAVGCIDDDGVIRGLPRYTASLDAITAAIKARWPLVWRVTSDEAASTAELNAVPVRRVITAEADTPALALCLAAARLALAEQGDG